MAVRAFALAGSYVARRSRLKRSLITTRQNAAQESSTMSLFSRRAASRLERGRHERLCVELEQL